MSRVYLALGSLIKDEPDLVEWVSYHRAIGVERFYLYDNESGRPVASVLQPLIARGIVKVEYIPGAKMQCFSFSRCCLTYKQEAEWITFLDGDEYLMTPKGGDIRALIEKYEKDEAGGILVNWSMFGDSCHKKRPEGLVIENFTYRAADNHPLHQFCKSIVKPRLVKWFPSSHAAVYHGDLPNVNTAHEAIHGPFSPVHFDVMRVNHYVTKSAEEYEAKIPLLRPDGSYRDVPMFYYRQHINTVQDLVMHRCISDTKKYMRECNIEAVLPEV